MLDKLEQSTTIRHLWSKLTILRDSALPIKVVPDNLEGLSSLELELEKRLENVGNQRCCNKVKH
jgi:hypothetical protein